MVSFSRIRVNSGRGCHSAAVGGVPGGENGPTSTHGGAKLFIVLVAASIDGHFYECSDADLDEV